ncbi:MAG: hypothetical protein GXP16_00540 [Gammaproteobacteria bacterium]|nr:hypothetical protein [Gammaproteobacteria bacterium]
MIIATAVRAKIFTKLALVSSALLLTLGLSLPAHAGGSYSGHYGGHHGGYYGGHHGGYYNRHYSHSYRDNYYYGYRRHHRRYDNTAAYIAGGLVLGSLLTHTFDRHPSTLYTTNEFNGRRTVVSDNNRRVSRRLYKDRQGNCFEKTYTPAGDELLSELDPNQCAW